MSWVSSDYVGRKFRLLQLEDRVDAYTDQFGVKHRAQIVHGDVDVTVTDVEPRDDGYGPGAERLIAQTEDRRRFTCPVNRIDYHARPTAWWYEDGGFSRRPWIWADAVTGPPLATERGQPYDLKTLP